MLSMLISLSLLFPGFQDMMGQMVEARGEHMWAFFSIQFSIHFRLSCLHCCSLGVMKRYVPQRLHHMMVLNLETEAAREAVSPVPLKPDQCHLCFAFRRGRYCNADRWFPPGSSTKLPLISKTCRTCSDRYRWCLDPKSGLPSEEGASTIRDLLWRAASAAGLDPLVWQHADFQKITFHHQEVSGQIKTEGQHPQGGKGHKSVPSSFGMKSKPPKKKIIRTVPVQTKRKKPDGEPGSSAPVTELDAATLTHQRQGTDPQTAVSEKPYGTPREVAVQEQPDSVGANATQHFEQSQPQAAKERQTQLPTYEREQENKRAREAAPNQTQRHSDFATASNSGSDDWLNEQCNAIVQTSTDVAAVLHRFFATPEVRKHGEAELNKWITLLKHQAAVDTNLRILRDASHKASERVDAARSLTGFMRYLSNGERQELVQTSLNVSNDMVLQDLEGPEQAPEANKQHA